MLFHPILYHALHAAQTLHRPVHLFAEGSPTQGCTMMKIAFPWAALAGIVVCAIMVAIVMTFGRTEIPHALGSPEEAAATLRSLYRLFAASIGLVTAATLYAAQR